MGEMARAGCNILAYKRYGTLVITIIRVGRQKSLSKCPPNEENKPNIKRDHHCLQREETFAVNQAQDVIPRVSLQK